MSFRDAPLAVVHDRDKSTLFTPEVRAAISVAADGNVQMFPVGPMRNGRRVAKIAWKQPPPVVEPTKWSGVAANDAPARMPELSVGSAK